MPQTDYSNNYLLYDAIGTKNLSVVVEVEGLGEYLGSGTIYKRVSFGDPGLVYGESGIVYGGLRARTDVRPYLDLNGGSLTISQRLEPEQGRGAVSTISLSFIDKDEYMTRLVSPGVIIPDILGTQVKVYLGFQQISFPDDYTVIFRGRVSSYQSESGRVTLQFSDANMKRRESLFYIAKTNLSADIAASATTIPVASNSDFFQQVLGPSGGYDSAVTTYIKIGDEYIEYPATGTSSSTAFTGCLRGQRGTVAVSAASGDEVDACVQIEDHCIDMALKIMLSGWDGDFKTGVTIQDVAFSLDPTVTNTSNLIVLGNGKSASRDYGLYPGDYGTLSGMSVSGNNGQFKIDGFVEIYDVPDGGIITDRSFIPELSPTGTIAFRSQYDTYPTECGLKLSPDDVDVQRHNYIRNTFMGSSENDMRFFIQSTEDSGKTFIENQLYLPAALYSLTRFGRMSVQLTHPPLADQRLQVLDGANVLNPQNIRPQRGINNRKFFNEIDWSYDYGDDGNPQSLLKAFDSDSISIIGITVTLPIEAKGVRTDLGSVTTINRRTQYLLSRYKNGAVLLDVEVSWGVGSLIESGDVIALKDNGVLKISNFTTGTRNLGTQLFEVVNRDLDVKKGCVKLQLVSGLGAEITDRYATISPSSVIQTGSATGQLIISESYGGIYGTEEYRKWQDYLGVRVKVHSTDYTVSSTATLVSLDQFDKNKLNISGLSGIAASALPGLILDIDDYSTSTDPTDQQIVKVVHCFQDARVLVASGVSSTQFTVASGDIDKFQDGFPIVVHSDDWSQVSPETTVASVNAGTYTVTVTDSLGFTPSTADFCDLLGFPDGSIAYRLI